MGNTKRNRMANCLRKHRRARGLQQKDVARVLGLKSASMISRWEKGVCLPNTMNVFRLAALYRTMPSALFIDMARTIRADILKREEGALRCRIKK